MTTRSILVTCSNDSRYLDRLDLAFALADRHDAHVSVVHVLPTPEELHGARPAASAAFIEARLETARQLGKELEQKTLEHAKSKGRTIEWIWESANLHESVARQALLADLTIVGRSEADSFEDWVRDHLVDYLTREIDTPVLYAPPTGDYVLPTTSAMVAWDGSSPAIRAVRAALPVLARIDVVHVVSLAKSGGTPLEIGSALVHYLSQHDIHAELHGNETTETDNGAALLAMAEKLGAELIVMGAHSKLKLRQILFGSVTRTLLARSKTLILLTD